MAIQEPSAVAQQVEADFKQAMKARDKDKIAVLRMLKAKLQEAAIAAGVSHVDEAGAAKAIAKYGKQVRESLEGYQQAGRAEAVAKAEAELAVLEGYLPKQLDDAALEALAAEVIAEVGANSPKDMGRVMGKLVPKLQGQADGKRVSAVVSRLLAAQS